MTLTLNSKAYDVIGLVSNLNKQLGYDYSSEGDEFTSPIAVRGTKAFIIGFIPPDNPVRFFFVEKAAGSVLKAINVEAQQAPTGQAEGQGGARKSKFENVASLPDSFWDKYVAGCKNGQMDPKDLATIILYESGFSPSAMPKDYDPKTKNVAKGLIQFTKPALRQSKIDKDLYARFENLSAEEQLPYVFNYFRGATPKGGWSDGGQMYTYVIASGALAKSNNGEDKDFVIYSAKEDAERNITNFASNAGLADKHSDHANEIRVSDMYRASDVMKRTPAYQLAAAKIDEAEKRAANGQVSAPIEASIEGGDGQVDYVGILSSRNDVTDNESDNPMQQIGQNLTAVNGARMKIANDAVMELESQIEIAKSIPSLVMYVNPKSFSKHYEHQVDYVKGRRRQIVSMHIEKPCTISGKGTTGAQFSVRQSDYAGGLSHQNRIASLSYLNLMSLATMYRNNGVIHTANFSADGGNIGVPIIPMSCFIYYDKKVYVGSFDSFGISDSADKPHSLDYDFQFTVKYEVDIRLMSGPAPESLAPFSFGSTVTR